MKRKFNISRHIASALVLSAMACTMGTYSVSADEAATSDEPAVTSVEENDSDNPVTTVSGDETVSDGEVTAATTSVVNQFLDNKPNNDNPYYQDEDVDTDGNATLIKKEQIIYNSEEMQFIAVTTKDGSVFYVLINYAAAGEEDNVYFLNKVDDYDLYALLYTGNDENEVPPDEAAANAAEKAEQVVNPDSAEPVVTELTEPDVPSNPSSGIPFNLILIIGITVLVLAAVGVILFKFVFAKKPDKSKTPIDFDEDDDDFDFRDEDE